MGKNFRDRFAEKRKGTTMNNMNRGGGMMNRGGPGGGGMMNRGGGPGGPGGMNRMGFPTWNYGTTLGPQGPRGGYSEFRGHGNYVNYGFSGPRAPMGFGGGPPRGPPGGPRMMMGGPGAAHQLSAPAPAQRGLTTEQGGQDARRAHPCRRREPGENCCPFHGR